MTNVVYAACVQLFTFEREDATALCISAKAKIHGGGVPDKPSGMPALVWTVIKMCWKLNPRERPAANIVSSMLKDCIWRSRRLGSCLRRGLHMILVPYRALSRQYTPTE